MIPAINFLLIIVIVTLFILNIFGINKFGGLKGNNIFITAIAIIFLVLFLYTGVAIIFNLVFSLMIIWSFTYALVVDRKYLYGTSMVFLISGILMLLGGIIVSIAEYIVILAFLLLVIGVFKDLIYEKIFGN